MKRIVILVMIVLMLAAGCGASKTTVKLPFGDFTVNSIKLETQKADRTPGSGMKFVCVDLVPTSGNTDMDACSAYFENDSSVTVSGVTGDLAFLVYDADVSGKTVGATLVYEVSSSVQDTQNCSIQAGGQTYNLD